MPGRRPTGGSSSLVSNRALSAFQDLGRVLGHDTIRRVADMKAQTRALRSRSKGKPKR